jgi:hypothetical protein
MSDSPAWKSTGAPARAVLANFILMQPQTELGRPLAFLENVDDP